MRSPTAEQIGRYQHLIRAAIGDTFLFRPEAEIGAAVQVERGGVWPMCLAGHEGAELNARVDRLIELSGDENLSRITVVDSAGHSRPAYLGLLVYSWVGAYRCGRGQSNRSPLENWRPAILAWCGMLEAAVNRLDWPIGGIPAARGSAASASLWSALALLAAGGAFEQRRWVNLAAGIFGRLCASQQPGGAFLRAGASDNPETRWYNELVILHAATSYALQANDALATASVMQAAEFHLRETQPDHATTQPWGLAAFIWRRDANDLADAMLHALRTQQPRRADGVSSLLLADTLYSLSLM